MVQPNEQQAYDAFLYTGRVADYLNYLDIKQQGQGRPVLGDVRTATGENSAYHDRWDRTAGAGG